jgi:hypothetical protein
MLVHCPRCRFSFEAPNNENNPRCRSCGGPTVPNEDSAAPTHEVPEAKTQKNLRKLT